MNNLKYLEIKRLIKELEFVETNFEYQSEILKITELDFNKSIYTFLRKFPELESIYKERKEELDSILSTGTALEDIITETKEEIESIDSPQIKKLYRDIDFSSRNFNGLVLFNTYDPKRNSFVSFF